MSGAGGAKSALRGLEALGAHLFMAGAGLRTWPVPAFAHGRCSHLLCVGRQRRDNSQDSLLHHRSRT